MSDDTNENPYSGLDRIFHEPNRLAILSALAGSADGCSFKELKEACGLTDGNLNRHLKTLADADAIEMERITGSARPKTVVRLTASGRSSFVAYLKSLEEVLRRAAGSLDSVEEGKGVSPGWGGNPVGA